MALGLSDKGFSDKGFSDKGFLDKGHRKEYIKKGLVCYEPDLF
jgi:hypothetical protein